MQDAHKKPPKKHTPSKAAAIRLTLLLFSICTKPRARYQNSEPPSEMNITGTQPQAGNLKLFVPSLSTQGSTRPKQNMFNVVLMRPDKTE